jgi:acetyltransferase-like isoleucine patch superfamily enzyme
MRFFRRAPTPTPTPTPAPAPAPAFPPASEPSNIVDVDRTVLNDSNLQLDLKGSSNTLKIARPSMANRVSIHMAGNASVHIEEGCVLGSLFIYAAPGSSVTIGRRVGFNGLIRLLLHEAQSITIGDGCLFGGEVDVTVSDMHSIVDATTGERINPAGSVTLGPRVWVGQKSTILKHVTIGSDCVIGAGSIVTRDVPSNCLAVGNPARVVRQNIAWRHDLI